MTDEQLTYNNIAPLRNVMGMTELIEQLDRRPTGIPGFGTFYGFSGYGKTWAASHAAISSNAVHVRIGSQWSAKKLCTSILFELGIPPVRVVADMVEQIGAALTSSQRTLMIDEADFLIRRKMIEIVRDMLDFGDLSIVLIGEENLPQMLKTWDRVGNRVLKSVAAQPSNIEDLLCLAKIYAPGVHLGEGMAESIVAQTRGNTRRICISLVHVHEFALTQSLEIVSLENWGSRGFFTGEAPTPRKSA